MRKAKIFMAGVLAGILEEFEGEYLFSYDADYLSNSNAIPVSLTMPLSAKPYKAHRLHSFFNGLIPEGWLLNIAAVKFNLDSRDRMGLLLALCQNTIGAVEVTPDSSNQPQEPEETEFIPTIAWNGFSTERIPKFKICLHCLHPLPAAGHNLNYHETCSERLFGNPSPPLLNLTEGAMEEIAARNLKRKMSLTGAQQKFSGRILVAKNRQTIILPGEFIVKPEPRKKGYRDLAVMELLGMVLAARLKISVADCGVTHLPNGTPVYVTRRFDRTDKGEKIHMEDFAQILGKTFYDDKYSGSLEQIVEKITQHTSRFQARSLSMFLRQSIYNFLIGNADNHFRNFSLMTGRDTSQEISTILSPGYDILPSNIFSPKDDDESALCIGGKKKKIGRRQLIYLAEKSGGTAAAMDAFISEFESQKTFIKSTLDVLGCSEHTKTMLLQTLGQRIEQIKEAAVVVPWSELVPEENAPQAMVAEIERQNPLVAGDAPTTRKGNLCSRGKECVTFKQYGRIPIIRQQGPECSRCKKANNPSPNSDFTQSKNSR